MLLSVSLLFSKFWRALWRTSASSCQSVKGSEVVERTPGGRLGTPSKERSCRWKVWKVALSRAVLRCGGGWLRRMIPPHCGRRNASDVVGFPNTCKVETSKSSNVAHQHDQGYTEECYATTARRGQNEARDHSKHLKLGGKSAKCVHDGTCNAPKVHSAEFTNTVRSSGVMPCASPSAVVIGRGWNARGA